MADTVIMCVCLAVFAVGCFMGGWTFRAAHEQRSSESIGPSPDVSDRPRRRWDPERIREPSRRCAVPGCRLRHPHSHVDALMRQVERYK